MQLFDFDGCAYAWYAFDIANALYLALWLGRRNDAGADFAQDIVRGFLKGYRSANGLTDFWLAKIPMFMMCCKIALFGFGCDSENPGSVFDGEVARAQMRNIEDGVLFADGQITMHTGGFV